MTTPNRDIMPRPQVSGNIRVFPGALPRRGEQPDVLYTRGLGACIGVAVYDASTKIGHMAHIYSTLGAQKTTLEPLLDSVRLGSTPDSELSAWVMGGSSEASIRGEKILRTRTVSGLAKLALDPESLSINWNDDEHTLVSMALDCGTGELEVVKSPVFS